MASGRMLSLNFEISHECIGPSALSEYQLQISASEPLYQGPFLSEINISAAPVHPTLWGELPMTISLYHPEKGIFSHWTNGVFPNYSECTFFEIELYCKDKGDLDKGELEGMAFSCH